MCETVWDARSSAHLVARGPKGAHARQSSGLHCSAAAKWLQPDGVAGRPIRSCASWAHSKINYCCFERGRKGAEAKGARKEPEKRARGARCSWPSERERERERQSRARIRDNYTNFAGPIHHSCKLEPLSLAPSGQFGFPLKWPPILQPIH